MIVYTNVGQTVTPHEKIDDEDGHYVVIEDTPIGDRCESTLASYIVLACDADSFQIKSIDCWVKARSVRWSKPLTNGQGPIVLSKSFAPYRNTEMPLE